MSLPLIHLVKVQVALIHPAKVLVVQSLQVIVQVNQLHKVQVALKALAKALANQPVNHHHHQILLVKAHLKVPLNLQAHLKVHQNHLAKVLANLQVVQRVRVNL